MQCSWIENTISVETDGWTRPCCLETDVAARISKISDGIKQAFDHPKLMQLREDLKNGFSKKTQYACKRCEDLEIRNQSSMRTQTVPIGVDRELKLLQFKMSNKCQLACAHCGPDRSSGWAKLLNITPHVINSFEVTEGFLSELVSILPQLAVIKFTGGEPFLDPNHWKILEHLQYYDKSHCELHYITNGVSSFKKELWKGWKNVNCSVSVDGYKDTYEWFRRGASWSDITKGVQQLTEVSNVTINYSITPYTIQDYDVAKDFWQHKLTAHPIVYPNHASMFNFPKKLIQELDNWQNIPYADSASGSSSLMYKLWAKNWDKKWNTTGTAEKLFWWMNK